MGFVPRAPDLDCQVKSLTVTLLSVVQLAADAMQCSNVIERLDHTSEIANFSVNLQS